MKEKSVTLMLNILLICSGEDVIHNDHLLISFSSAWPISNYFFQITNLSNHLDNQSYHVIYLTVILFIFWGSVLFIHFLRDSACD